MGDPEAVEGMGNPVLSLTTRAQASKPSCPWRWDLPTLPALGNLGQVRGWEGEVCVSLQLLLKEALGDVGKTQAQAPETWIPVPV